VETEKLKKLLEQKKALDAQLMQERNKISSQKRKLDTRKKILVGSAVLSEADKQPEYKTALYELLGRFLTKENDRALFDLPSLQTPAPEKPKAEPKKKAKKG
jgi:large subunit ribosomal protein L7/L12